MDYRGSKSAICANIAVKEQRVDGSYVKAQALILTLRCTLMGLERGYQNKILSKSLNRYYSTKINPTDTSQKNELNMYPCFVSGFIDGEGSFSCASYAQAMRKLHFY